MEKNVAVKEWCVEQSIILHMHSDNQLSADTIVKDAKEIEKYINS